MHYKKRFCEERLAACFAAYPCVVVTGARQVGKSTLLAHLVVEYSGKLFPVEIKAASKACRADTSGIRAFCQMFPDVTGEGLVIYAGEQVARLDESVLAVPFDWVAV
jgi:hypothetical protein